MDRPHSRNTFFGQTTFDSWLLEATIFTSCHNFLMVFLQNPPSSGRRLDFCYVERETRKIDEY